MKKRIRHFSKSTLSIVLSLCMLVSCVSVGLIATDAAQINAGEKVGADTWYLEYKKDMPSDYYDGDTNVQLTQSSKNSNKYYKIVTLSANSSYGFFIKKNNDNNSCYKANVTASSNQEVELSAYNGNLGQSSNRVTYQTGDATSYVFTFDLSNNKISVSPTTSTTVKMAWDTASGNDSNYNLGNYSNMTHTGDGVYSVDLESLTAAKYYMFIQVDENRYLKSATTLTQNNATGANVYDYGTNNFGNSGDKINFTPSTAGKYRFTFDIKDKTVNMYNLYTVTFNANSHGTPPSAQTVLVGGKATEPTAPTASGYTFGGWYKESSCTNAWNFSTDTVTSDTTLYAKWISKLAAPTNVKLNNATSDQTVTATTVGDTVSLTWDSVTNAGSYKVYKGDSLVTTVTTTSYSIEKAYSSNGKYTVVAVPSNTDLYTESNKSTGYTLTVNKKKLSTPTVTINPTDIVLGNTVNLTATDSNSGVTAAQYNLYYYETSVSATESFKMTSGTAKSITPSTVGAHTYKVVAYPVGGTDNDYYTQSDAASATEINVYSAPYRIAGGLVGTAWSYDSGIAFTNYLGNGLFSYQTSSLTYDTHYFSLYDSSNYQYSGDNNDSNCVITLGEENKYTLTKNTNNKSFAVTGSGVFYVYYDTVNGKIWVTQTTWAITPHVYYQSYNLETDAYNAAQEGTDGGTVTPNAETLVPKEESVQLTAAPAANYTFAGWYSSSTFTDANRIDTANPYSYTPDANGSYYALFKQVEPAHYNVTAVNADGNADVTVTYNGESITPGSRTLSVPVGASVTYTISPKTGCSIDSRSPASLITSDSGQFTMPASATAVTVVASKINYTLTGATSPTATGIGSVTFYSDAGCENVINTATYQQTIYAKYTSPSVYYTLGSFTADSDSGATVNSGTGNVRSVQMGAHNLTLTANIIATTPVIGVCTDMEVFANESFTYAQPSVTPTANSTLTFSYTFQGETNNTGTFTAPVTAETYPLTITASNKPAGISVAATASVTVNITVTYRNEKITYYVDMHDNVISSSGVEVAIVDAQNSNKVKSIGEDKCKATLVQQGDAAHLSSVYAAGIKTPFVKNGDEYNALHIRITYNGVSYWKELNSNQIKTVQDTKSIWFEAVNESSLDLKLTTADYTGTPKVASGKKRIYVAKPISWESDTPWTTVGIYYWDKDISTEWKSADNEMKHLGKDSAYHYYYADIPSGANNIIFQGREGVDTYSQTNNIENIKTNSFVLYKDGTSPKGKAADAAAAIPALTKYISTAQMNKGTKIVDISPVRFTAASVEYDNSDVTVVSVTDEGKINALKSGTATITVKLHSSISEKITTAGAYIDDDVISCEVAVTVHDPKKFEGFNIMSLGTSEYTFDIPKVTNNQPGYFLMGANDIVVTVTGLVGFGSSTKSAVITSSETVSVKDLDSQTSKITVKYADPTKAFSSAYNNIRLSGTLTTRSIRNDGGSRYGFTEWQRSDETKPTYLVKKTITENQTETALDGVETAVTSNFAFDTQSTYYKAVFDPYAYVDVTFTYHYYEYKPRLDNGLYNYQYEYGNDDYLSEDIEDERFDACHNAKQYIRTKYEVRDETATSLEEDGDLVKEARKAIEAMPQNSYYDYSIDKDCLTITGRNATNFTAAVTVNLIHTPRKYAVTVNGNDAGEYYYQQYATVNKPDGSGEHVKWYECNDQSDLTSGTPNYPLLSTGNSYKFRVKDDTHLRIVNGSLTAQDFNRSEVDFMNYDLTHLNNKEYVMQNFYIADFFNPMETYETETRKCDDATFVGGGVVYYSMKGGSPNSATAAYVDQDTGTIDKEAIAEMLKENIESSITEDKYSKTFEQYEAELGTDEAMKIAYGTEIPVTQNYDRNGKTGIMYRYLPLQTYQTNKNKELVVDENGNFVTTVNDNTFRYSNTLQAYQYIYASGNENKETNEGRNMRLYAYYVYSYQGYDLETNVPETRYVVVISDNYSDASTYWAGN